MENEMANDARQMRANRSALAAVCVTCGRSFRFGEGVARCSVCGRFQHVDCWEGNTCPHREALRPAVRPAFSETAGNPAPPRPATSTPLAALPPLAAPPPLAVVKQLAADERRCPACGEIVKSAALQCRFCKAFLDERLAASEIPAALAQAAANDAKAALTMGLLGLLICAPVFAPQAIGRGNAALKTLDLYPLYDGPRGKARAGIVLGYIDWALFGIGLLTRLSKF